MTGAGFSVRLSTEADIPAIIALVKDSWARTYDPLIGAQECTRISDAKHVPALFLSEIGKGEAASFVAFDREAMLIGHVGGAIRGSGICFVDRLHVAPAWQGRGVAKALMDAVCARMGGQAAALELTVLEGNGRAAGFYRNYGFFAASEALAPGLGQLPARTFRLYLAGRGDSPQP